jgi:hypothetical protein
MVLTFIRDLMFGSKIDELLRQLGIEQRKIRSLSEAQTLPEGVELEAVIINLAIPGDEPFLVAAHFIERGLRVFGYFPHIEEALYERAVAIGVKEVHPRGAILSVLAQNLSGQNR